MSILIDKLIRNSQTDDMSEHDGKWYIAKPIDFHTLWFRIKEAWKVLVKKAYTFHYKVDEND